MKVCNELYSSNFVSSFELNIIKQQLCENETEKRPTQHSFNDGVLNMQVVLWTKSAWLKMFSQQGTLSILVSLITLLTDSYLFEVSSKNATSGPLGACTFKQIVQYPHCERGLWFEKHSKTCLSPPDASDRN